MDDFKPILLKVERNDVVFYLEDDEVLITLSILTAFSIPSRNVALTIFFLTRCLIGNSSNDIIIWFRKALLSGFILYSLTNLFVLIVPSIPYIIFSFFRPLQLSKRFRVG